MIAKLVVEGHEFDIEILDPKLQELIAPKKKTGYERVEHGKNFYHTSHSGHWITQDEDVGGAYSNDFYNAANYYSSQELAQNNARADKLMRQLRRFAVEHRVNKLNWESDSQAKWLISYNSCGKNSLDCGLIIEESRNIHSHGVVYFDRIIDADAAIEAFRDELIWYFTEYKDSL